MRRLLTLLALGVAVVAASAAGGDEPAGLRYTVELDTGTGLVDGGDFKVAGIRAGIIEKVRLQPRTRHALADIRIDDPAAGALHTDARCEVRPQSLLGEYFLDCDPGTAPRELDEGATVPVEQTASTIPPDLVTNVLRRPYADRLRLIVSSLGAGVAGGGDRLDTALRRAVPAIRETDRVLALLARQERDLDGLTRDADTVLTELARRRRDVGRFVDETAKAATAAASRRTELRSAIASTPGFLRELTPTMRALGDLAQAGTPALADTRASAKELERTLTALPPVADGARPAIAALGRAARTGRPLVPAVRRNLALLRSGAKRLPEVFTNLAIVLRHLDDRDNAVEDDVRSPGGKGFTGLEGLLRYIVYQGTTINSFDAASHILNAALFESHCAFYREPADLRADPALASECSSALGPNQPGITTPDPTATSGRGTQRRSGGPERRPAASPVPDMPGSAPAPAVTRRPSATPAPDATEPLIDLGGLLDGVLPPGLLPGGPGATDDAAARDQLLDFLLSP